MLRTRTKILSSAESLRLDAIRACAALVVFFSHWRTIYFVPFDHLGPKPGLGALTFYWLTSGGQAHRAVLVFFVLSGFLVGGSVLRAFETGRWSTRVYAANRLTRLYTVLIPAIASCLILDWSIAKSSTGLAQVHQMQWDFGVHTVSVVLENLAFLQNILGPTLGTNAALWSLANEFWYYTLFPMLAFVVFTPRLLQKVLGCVALIVLAIFVKTTLLIGMVWLAGISLHYVPAIPERLLPTFVQRILTGILGLMLLAFTSIESRLSWDSANLVAGTIAALFVYFLLHLAPLSPSRPALQGVITHLSALSYTLYLFHLTALIAVAVFLHRPRQAVSPHSILSACLALFVVFAFVELMYVCFERNTSRIRTWIGTWPKFVRAR